MHLTPYSSDVFGNIQTVVAAAKGQKEKVDGLHAAFGLADYAALTLLDTAPAPKAANEDCTAWANEALAEFIEDKCLLPRAGVEGIDWSNVLKDVWTEVKPVVWQLIQRWFL